jgi:hypothetical protein
MGAISFVEMAVGFLTTTPAPAPNARATVVLMKICLVDFFLLDFFLFATNVCHEQERRGPKNRRAAAVEPGRCSNSSARANPSPRR